MPSISYYPTSNAKNANTLVCDQNSTLYCAVPRHWSQPADNLGDWQSVGKNPGTSQIQNFELIIPVHVVARLGRGCRFVNLGILTCECQVKTEFSLRPICRHEAVSCLLFCRGHSRVATFPCTQIPSSFILLPTPVNQGRLRPGGTLLCVAVPSLCYHSSYLGRALASWPKSQLRPRLGMMLLGWESNPHKLDHAATELRILPLNTLVFLSCRRISLPNRWRESESLEWPPRERLSLLP